MATIETLDCGHLSTPNRYLAGYATASDGHRICYNCADVAQREDLKTADRFTAYLSVPQHTATSHTTTGSTLTTWTGGRLARVTYLTKCRHNIGGHLYRFEAFDVHGQRWIGTSPGPGMYARMRRAKTQEHYYKVVWSPEGRTLNCVWAKDAKSAIRKVTRGTSYAKYRGEVYAEDVTTTFANAEMGK